MDRQSDEYRNVAAYLLSLVPTVRKSCRRVGLPTPVLRAVRRLFNAIEAIEPDDLSHLWRVSRQVRNSHSTLLTYLNSFGRMRSERLSPEAVCAARAAALGSALMTLHLADEFNHDSWFRYHLCVCWYWLSVAAGHDDRSPFAVIGEVGYSEGVRQKCELFGRQNGLRGVWLLLTDEERWYLARVARPGSPYAVEGAVLSVPNDFRAEVVWRGPSQGGRWMLETEPEPHIEQP